MRPAAGIVGVVAHPFQGAWRSLQTTTGQRQEHQFRVTRISDGREDVKNSSAAQRAEIFRKFKDAQRGKEQREKKYQEIVEKVMQEDAEERGKANGASEEYSDAKDGSSSSQSRTDSTPSVATSSTSSTAATPASETEDDSAFERDLEFAKQLSLAEQRGYERGVASRFA